MPILSSQEIIRLAEDLPQLSPAAIKIISLVDNPNTSRDKIVSLIKSDSQIFAECMKQSNSAAVASRREFTTINQIVDSLGFNHIKKVSLFMSARVMYRDPSIWFESVFTAVAAHYLALKAGFDLRQADSIYMAGLFNNYGAFVLKTAYPALYNKVLNVNPKEKMKNEKIEFGCTSSDVSALLMSKYGLPEYVTEILASQSSVYSDKVKPENAFIELARILSTIHNLNIEKIHATLNLSAVRTFIENARIEDIGLTEESVHKLKVQTNELVRT